MISKEIYQFLPGTSVKMRAIFISYSLKIATYVANVIVFFGASPGQPSVYKNSMGLRTPSFKRSSLNSSRDRSTRKSDICEAADPLPCFPLQIATYVGPL